MDTLTFKELFIKILGARKNRRDHLVKFLFVLKKLSSRATESFVHVHQVYCYKHQEQDNGSHTSTLSFYYLGSHIPFLKDSEREITRLSGE